jgi:hypothetical protein
MEVSPEGTKPPGDEMRPDYDFHTMRGVVRGKYAAAYRERLRIVRLANDVGAAFADEAAVNEALREYLRNLPAAETPA